MKPNIFLSETAKIKLILDLLVATKEKFKVDGEAHREIWVRWGSDTLKDCYVELDVWSIGTLEIATETWTLATGFFRKKKQVLERKKYRYYDNIHVRMNHVLRVTITSSSEKFDEASLWLAQQLTPFFNEVHVSLESPEKIRGANPNPKPPTIVDPDGRAKGVVETMK